MQFYQNLPDFEFPPEFGNVIDYLLLIANIWKIL